MASFAFHSLFNYKAVETTMDSISKDAIQLQQMVSNIRLYISKEDLKRFIKRRCSAYKSLASGCL